MQALHTARHLDWSGWLRGLIGAFISGGSGAVGAAFGTIVADPEHFNLAQGLGETFEVMGVVFLVSSIVSLAKYLQTSPVPEETSEG